MTSEQDIRQTVEVLMFLAYPLKVNTNLSKVCLSQRLIVTSRSKWTKVSSAYLHHSPLHLSWCPSELHHGQALVWEILLWGPPSWVYRRARASGLPFRGGALRSRLWSHYDCSWKSLYTCNVRGQRGGVEQRRGLPCRNGFVRVINMVRFTERG